MAANADPTFEGLRFVAEGGHSEQCRGEKSCATVPWNFISAPSSLRQGQKALIVLRHDFEPRARTTTGTHWPQWTAQRYFRPPAAFRHSELQGRQLSSQECLSP
jgi:hypothetical protein